MRGVSRAGVLLLAFAGASLLSCSDGPTGPAPITSVSVSPVTITLARGATSPLAAVALDAKGKALEGRVFAWSSSDIFVANVSPAGIVTAGQNRGGSPAIATITAVSEGKSATATVMVTPVPAARVVLTPDSVLILPGANTTLTAAVEDAGGAALSGRSLMWQSLDTTVARVSTAGQVTAVAYVGPVSRETRVIATAEGRADTTRVVVPPLAAARVVLTPDSASLQVGATQTFTAVAKDAAGTALTGRTIAWGTTDSSVATVSSAGVLTAVAYAGPATRTARLIAATAGKADTAPVVVTPVPVGRVNATPDTLVLLPGATATLTAGGDG